MTGAKPKAIAKARRSESVRPIAVAADHRLALLPDVPTFLELGVTYKTANRIGMQILAQDHEATPLFLFFRPAKSQSIATNCRCGTAAGRRYGSLRLPSPVACSPD